MDSGEQQSPSSNEPKNGSLKGDIDALQKFEQRASISKSIDDNAEPTSLKEIARKWPKATFCIIGNEFCERFSYYGMRAVLTLYVMNILAFSNTNATILFHAFIVFCYTSPIIGSVLADGYIGKFWTIIWLSLLYAAGQIILAVSSTFHTGSYLHPTLDLIGLAIIGIGTGGIKPCVSAFGGDQFNPHHTRMISIFFSIFYFSINAGSTISMFITPIFRSIPCNGQDSCYPMAFGVPAALMILATALFVLGSKSYKKYPPKENVIARVVNVIFGAIKNKMTSKTKRDHWLDHYLDTHQCEMDKSCVELMSKTSSKNTCSKKAFVEDVQALLRVVVMLLPIPVFWALYDQQGSKWILQAISMNYRITSSFVLLPDQMGTVNAILIMIFIPIFQFIIYPLVEKLGIRTTPLRRMVAGGVLASLAFVICALIQFRVNQTLPDKPPPNTAFVSFVNLYDKCNVTLRSANLPTKTIPFNSSLVDANVDKNEQIYRIPIASSAVVKFQLTPGQPCNSSSSEFTMELEGGKSYVGILSHQGFAYDTANLNKPTSGQEQSSININSLIPCSMLPSSVTWATCTNRVESKLYSDGIALCKHNAKGLTVCDPKDLKSFFEWTSADARLTENAAFYSFKDVDTGTYDVYYFDGDNTVSKNAVRMNGVTVELDGMGAVFSLTIQKSNRSEELEWNMHTLVPANNISILWQIPPYFVITAAEILISITGLEFAYSQAPPAMKSVVQAVWLFTVAAGDIIIIVIELIDFFENLALEMLLYAGVMLFVILIFALLAIFYYEYADYADEQEEENCSSKDGSSKQDDSVKNL